MKLIFSIAIFIWLVSLSACYYDKEELLYGNNNSGPCTDSTGIVSYSQKIIPVFQQFCYSCHNSSFPSGNITMGTYTADKAIGLNGKLFGSINHTTGFSPMPKGMAKLNNCHIATIKKWIDQNMPNN